MLNPALIPTCFRIPSVDPNSKFWLLPHFFFFDCCPSSSYPVLIAGFMFLCSDFPTLFSSFTGCVIVFTCLIVKSYSQQRLLGEKSSFPLVGYRTAKKGTNPSYSITLSYYHSEPRRGQTLGLACFCDALCLIFSLSDCCIVPSWSHCWVELHPYKPKYQW